MFISVQTAFNQGESETEKHANELILCGFSQLLKDHAGLGAEFGEFIGFAGSTEEMVKDPSISDTLRDSIVPRLKAVDEEFKTQFAANLDKGVIVGDTSRKSNSMGIFYLNVDPEAYTFVSVVIVVMSSKHPFDVYKTFGRFMTTEDQFN